MWRSAFSKLGHVLRDSISSQAPKMTAKFSAEYMDLDPEDFIEEMIQNFSRFDIDGWWVRKYMNDLLGMDMVPDPKIIVAGLHACRRVNDIALAIRWIEGCKNKCGNQVDIIFPYLMKEIRPTMVGLGVPTLEELYYDKPQFALESVMDM